MEENQLKQLEESKIYVNETRKWMKLFGIIMIIGIACLVVMAISFMSGGSALANTLSGNLPEINGITAVSGVIYLIFAGIMAFPTIYIFRAVKAAKAAVESNDNAQMVEFLKNTKSYWKFMGIYTIVMLVFALIIVLFTIIAAIAIG
ncbi:MAG: DUF5362 family protein [Bacteroidales bacterium]|nr:DUF5362 family protein [Bacteroidales bacterium]